MVGELVSTSAKELDGWRWWGGSLMARCRR
jgi:hypothetical protein